MTGDHLVAAEPHAPSRPRPRVLDTRLAKAALTAYSRANVWLYRKTGGRVGGRWRLGSAFPWGAKICLLTTTGRRSGLPRTTPLIYLRDGGRIVVVASQGGMARHPQWYLNLRDEPRVQVQVGREVREMQARTAGPAERDELWPRLVRTYADFATYQSWAGRVIPVVICEEGAL